MQLVSPYESTRRRPLRPFGRGFGPGHARGLGLGLGLSLGLAALTLAPKAGAQAEAQKPQPNVLLLVDTSGSMEFKTDGTFPTCNPADPVADNEKSRWIDLVEVMTGTFNDYSCWAQDRSSSGFRSEFSVSGVDPYDFGYVNPYHRALSGACLYGPGVLPDAATPYDWPDGSVNTFSFAAGSVVRPADTDLPAHPGCAGFSQSGDGLLDIYKDQVRFGLMTFDTRVNAGTGLDGSTANYTTGMAGTWSYYLGSPITGHPANCSFDMIQEVGARNAAAPPWEGRMIAFGPPDLADNTERNTWIQEVLLSTRPYGATPVAGLLHDARNFLWNDTSLDPLDGSGVEEFGPSNDPNWRASDCRKGIVVLLTDGEPNLDLRPFCEAEPPPPETGGRCPYDRPEEIVSSMRLAPPTPALAVETYVIGFALGNVTPFGGSEISCDQLTDAHCSDPNNNDPNYPESKRIQACCRLNEIAAAGGLDEGGTPRKAFFAENRDDLRSIFTEILDDVVSVATRTMPVFSPPGGDTSSSGFKFFSAFDPQPDPEGPQLWEGVLERRRFVCNSDLIPEEQFDPARGDDFAANLNSGIGNTRWFFTALSDSDNRNSIRPEILQDDDGLGTNGGTQIRATSPANLVSQVTPEAMQLDDGSCDTQPTATGCRDLILQHAVGLTNADGVSRCTSGGCRLLGGVFHSTPRLVPGQPSALLRDNSYRAFTDQMSELERPTTLYTSTVDGFLHAFFVSPFPGSDTAEDDALDSIENNELWAFIPPAVLPVMQTQYPSTPAVLLDGLPIIEEVVAIETAGVTRFERSATDAASGSGQWRTVMLQGFGEGQVGGGYFALDITDPTRDGDGPRFLWQLTRDDAGTPLFGRGGTPLITSVFASLGGAAAREIAVAVLPGGDADAGSGLAASSGGALGTDPLSFASTRRGFDYTGAETARSLTIVRLDTGEVLRTFRPAAGAGPFNTSVFTATDIPAPIVGQPLAFSNSTGSVAQRVFVGDRDGRMWRVDLSSLNPDEWTMNVFFDAFWDGDETKSQPASLAPVVSINDEGNVTVAYATGDQLAAAAPPSTVNRVVSLTETLDSGNNFVAHVNWFQNLENAERVTGPMVLFNRGLFYAASRPPDTSSSACDVGQSKVYAAHYEHDEQRAQGNTPDPTSGPAKAPQVSNLLVADRSDGLIFGVNVEAEPTCASEEETFTGDDSYGYGAVTMSRTVNPGRFFLSFEVSGSGDDPRGVLEVRQELDSPRTPVSFDSWALIYE